MPKMENFNKVINILRAKAAQSVKDDNVSVVVGYTQNYALYVHENIQMKWKGLPRSREVRLGEEGGSRYVTTGHKAVKGAKGFFWGPKGQAKFLEGPARQLAGTLGEIVATAMRKGKTLAQGLLLAGLRLQRESQKLVPVDTGALKNSAFTRLERGGR